MDKKNIIILICLFGGLILITIGLIISVDSFDVSVQGIKDNPYHCSGEERELHDQWEEEYEKENVKPVENKGYVLMGIGIFLFVMSLIAMGPFQGDIDGLDLISLYFLSKK